MSTYGGRIRAFSPRFAPSSGQRLVVAIVAATVIALATGQALAASQVGPGPGGRPLWLACAIEARRPTSAEQSLTYRQLVVSLKIAGRYLGNPGRYRAQARAKFSRNFIARLDGARQARLRRHLPLTDPQAGFGGSGFVCDRGADGRKFYFIDLDIEYRFGESEQGLVLHGKCRLTPAANWYARFWTIA